MNKYFKEIDYKLLDEKTVYKGQKIQVEELKYYNPRRNMNIYREHILAGEGAVIIPVTKNNEFIMVQEPRTPIGKTVLTFPAGMIEPEEKPEDAAVRELEEETGYKAGNIQKLIEVYPAIGYSNERATIFLAKDLSETQMNLDETEDIEVIKIPIPEVKQMLDNNEINTASELIALHHYFVYEQNKNM